MAMSNAERQRKFRQNRDKDQTRRQQYLQAGRTRYAEDKASGKRKSFKDVTDRERRFLRRKWRKQKAKARAKHTSEKTPPNPPQSPRRKVVTSRQKAQRRKMVKKQQAKCYRDNKVLRLEINRIQSRYVMYKKRWIREKEHQSLMMDTPRTKTRKLIRHISKKTVRRTLLFQTAVMEQIRISYQQKRKTGKTDVVKILSGAILRKYKFKTHAWRVFGINARATSNQKEHTYLSLRECENITHFFERDDVSRLMTGTKQTVTSKKEKKQRRLLKDTMKNLHLKYISEDSSNIGFSTFCRLRPFWVVFPRPCDRRTCLCKLCENIQFMATSLKKAGLIQSDELQNLMSETVCNPEYQECMYSQCKECSCKRLSYDQKSEEKTVEWYQWKLMKEKRKMKINHEYIEKEVSITVKEVQEGSCCELKNQLEKELQRYKRHSFNIRHQYKYFKERKENLQENECILHIDFSENYACKMGSEVHGMHFGASKKQLSLHTGVYYCGNDKCHETFCTVSDNLEHGPGAVWAHLRPVLEGMRKKYPVVDSLYIFSDGPTAQYRQKTNFYLLTLKPVQFGFKKVEWNFFEAGHGKGVPDAVGGAIKRNADICVKYGKDITSAEEFVCAMRDSEIETILVPGDEIMKEVHDVSNVKLQSVKGTMKLHQICPLSPGSIAHRDVSCTCLPPSECKMHKLTKATLITEQKDVKAEARHTNQGETFCIKSKTLKRKSGKKQIQVSKKLRSDADHMTTRKSIREEKEAHTSEHANSYVDSGNLKACGARKTVINGENDSNECFENYLKGLEKCKTFTQLKMNCARITKETKEIDRMTQPVTFSDTNDLELDINAADYYPSDVTDTRVMHPCCVMANGNCLPSCGSVYAYGTIDRTAEMRVRIVSELVLNEETYLNNEFLDSGSNSYLKRKKSWPCVYAQYSDMFVPGTRLTNTIIRNIFRREIMQIRMDRAFMGIWQIHALASVLNTTVCSIYPMLGPPCVRQDLHRLIMPRREGGSVHTPLHILWTSTRQGMNNEHWIPNHFVPVLPYHSVQRKHDLKPKQSTEIEEDVHREEKRTDSAQEQQNQERKTEEDQADESLPTNQKDPIEDEAEDLQENGIPVDMKCREQRKVKDERNEASISVDKKATLKGKAEDAQNDSISAETNLKITQCGQKEVLKNHTEKETSPTEEVAPKKSDDVSFQDIPDPQGCVGRYVVVDFEGRPYPGYVEDADDADVYVECMHNAGRKHCNDFYWPKTFKDKCWYDHDRILAIIPEPKKIEGSSHFEVNSDIWTSIIKDNEKK